jgi:hypothetical protein
MAFAYCLDCGERIYLGKRPWVGQEAFCDHCGTDMEVSRLNPLELDWTDDLVNEDQDQLEEVRLVPV